MLRRMVVAVTLVFVATCVYAKTDGRQKGDPKQNKRAQKAVTDMKDAAAKIAHLVQVKERNLARKLAKKGEGMTEEEKAALKAKMEKQLQRYAERKLAKKIKQEAQKALQALRKAEKNGADSDLVDDLEAKVTKEAKLVRRQMKKEAKKGIKEQPAT